MPVALITGASRGLGYAIASDLATASTDGERWRLVIDARDSSALANAAAELRALGADVRAVAGDVADAAHREALAAVIDELGRVDLLVNNASVLGPSPQPSLGQYPLDVLTEVYRVNTVAPLALAQLLLPALRRTSGTIVDVTSDAGVEAYAGWGGYGSSKAALDQLSAVLAVEEPELRVYAFDPGDMRTRMHQEAFPGEDISDRPEPDSVLPAFRRLLAGDLPSGRYRASELTVPSTR